MRITLECGHKVEVPFDARPGDDFPCAACGEKAVTEEHRWHRSELGADGILSQAGLSGGGTFGHEQGIPVGDHDPVAAQRGVAHGANQQLQKTMSLLERSIQETRALQQEQGRLLARQNALLEENNALRRGRLLAGKVEEEEDEDDDVPDAEFEPAPPPKKKAAKKAKARR